nr:hypothetical protein [Cupriavidus sp. CV2]
MSTPQYNRKASLIIGQSAGDALDLSALRFVFDIRRGDLQTPNSARVRVFNVGPETARRVQKEFTRVVLQAGYAGNYGIIFDGNIKQVRRGRVSQTDTYLDITAADGDSAYNFAVVNTTLAAGSTVADHVGVCTKAMEPYGVGPGYTPWGQQSAKPAAADIAAQQAKVDAAKKAIDDHMAEWRNLLAQGKQFEGLGDGAAANGDQAGARAYYLQAKDCIDRAGVMLTTVKMHDTPTYNAELAKLDQMKAAAAAQDAPATTSQGLPRGKVMFGMARDFMRLAAKTTQTVWSIQDGNIVIVPETSYRPSEIPVITSATGMVGLPEQTQNGIRVKMLLNPNVKISQLIKIDNASIQRFEFSLNVLQQQDAGRIALQNKLQDDGFYYVMVAEHTGDTRGNDWYTEIVCLAADATVLPQDAAQKQTVQPPNAILKFG